MKKILFAISVLLILGNLWSGFFTGKIFSWGRQPVASLLNTPTSIALHSASTPRTRAIFEIGEKDFLIANDSGEISSRTFVMVGCRPTKDVGSKVSRYLFKSVLNI